MKYLRVFSRSAGVLLLAFLWLNEPAGHGAEVLLAGAAPDFSSMSLEELMKYPITSVSKRPENLSEAPAAIYLLTQEDIRRSGATSIPEVLRLVPGLDVARVDAHTWAISARGFNDVFANKLLVVQDGRSIYTPLFSGVFWDVQDTVLEDIDRIEVIRGPGATLWGANAVNGVINIITKKARDTQGFLISGGAGTEERGFGSIRYGGKLSDSAFFRVYGKYFDRDDSVQSNGANAGDGARMGRGGFRLDWDASDRNLFTFQGDAYRGRSRQIYTNATPGFPYVETLRNEFTVGGGNLLGRWAHTYSDSAELKLQLYYDRTIRETAVFHEKRDTYDIDLQHNFQLAERHNIVWGAGYRLSADKVVNSFTVSLKDPQRRAQLFSTFAQDEITLVKDRLKLTLGSKFEHNDYTGFEIQPSGRLLWTPSEYQSVWGSVSRAVRTPSRVEDDIVLNQVTGTPGLHTRVLGNSDFASEKLVAYEIGYRFRPVPRVALDVAAFYNVYHDLRSVEPIGFSPGPPAVATLLLANRLRGETYGFEFAPSWQVMDGWRLQVGYTYLQMQLHREPGSQDPAAETQEGRSPQHQVTVRSIMDFPHHLQFDSTVRYVGSLPTSGIRSYVALDLRLGWTPSKRLEFSLVGQNVLDAHHLEFRPSSIVTQNTEVERSVYGKITLRF